MKLRSRVIAIIFVVLLFTIGIVNAAMPKRDFSDNENRQLAQFPSFTVQNLLNGQFTTGFNTYITDQFAFRDTWVGGKTLADVALQKKDSNGAYFGSDGYIISSFNTVDTEKYTANLNLVHTFTKTMEKQDVQVHTAFIPTTSYVMSSKLPPFAPEVNQDALLSQAKIYIAKFCRFTRYFKKP